MAAADHRFNHQPPNSRQQRTNHTTTTTTTPGRPVDSGISLQAVRELGPDFPLFGVCMGHQCIGEAFGGDVVRAPTGVMHGKTSPVFHANTGILEGLPK